MYTSSPLKRRSDHDKSMVPPLILTRPDSHQVDFSVLGTDYDPSVVEFARLGAYTRHDVKAHVKLTLSVFMCDV